jgi:SAM-dependent methyltransferase
VERLLESLIEFYLAALSRLEPQSAARLNCLLASHEPPSALFLSHEPRTIPILLSFFKEMAALESSRRLVFDVHGNICWDFFARQLLLYLGWPGDPDTLRPDTAEGIAHRNATRRWLSHHLDATQFQLLEEFVAIQGFSSGGEALFLRYVWPRLQIFLQQSSRPRMLDAGCGSGYASLVMSTARESGVIFSVDSSEIRQARFAALLKYLERTSDEALHSTLSRCYSIEQSPEFLALHHDIDWREFVPTKIRTLRSRLEHLPVERISQVDGIVCVDVLEHVSDPMATVKSFSTLLRRGGMVFLSVPSIFSGLQERLYAITHGHLFPGMLHLNHFSEATLIDLFGKWNFRPREISRFRSPDYDAMAGCEGDLVEVLALLNPDLTAQDPNDFARHIFAVFEYLG